MIRRLRVLRERSHDPFHNLAVEEELLLHGGDDTCVLYLWQNRRTVVIGRNQSALEECRVQALEGDGGYLARRLSGGGAVYHDLGNLNFTFLLPTADFDERRQTKVILRAVRALGLEAERSGRNDLLLDGRKFSGHAYYHAGARSYHHGTLMVAVEREPLERYLRLSPLKLGARGVSSVRSRVCNLTEYLPGLTVEALMGALETACAEVYGLPAEPMDEAELDAATVALRRERFADPAWRYGRETVLPRSVERRFPWGTVRIDYETIGGAIAAAALYSDGMDADALAALPARLRGCPLRREELSSRLGESPEGRDIARMLSEEEGS